MQKSRVPSESILDMHALRRMEQIAKSTGDEAARRVLQFVLASVDSVLPMLEHCRAEAQAVLGGDLSAGDRLWLRLRSASRRPIDEIPESMLEEMWGPARRKEPALIGRDALLDLVMGTVRASNQPVESEAMLDALGRLLDPLFVAECAYHALDAAAEGRWSPIRLFAAWQLALTRERPGQLPPVQHTMDSPPFGDIWKERVGLDAGTWNSYHDSLVDKWKFVWECIGNGRLGMSQIDIFGARYTIDSISNPYACPGVSITISGRNFGPTGRVYFPTPDIDDPVSSIAVGVGIDATLWTDTQINVIVPVWARPGELHLNAFRRHEDLCVTKDIYRLGNTAPFYGGLPSIIDIKVNGRNKNAWAEPNTNATISWTTSPCTLTIEIRNAENPSDPPWKQENVPSSTGSVVWHTRSSFQPTKFLVVMAATNSCGTVTKSFQFLITVPATLKIEGVQVTQGIQTFSLTGGPRNTIPLVANKDTILRVYASASRGGWLQDKLTHFTASVRIDGKYFQPINKCPPGAMSGGDPYRDLGPAYLLRETDTEASFNFRIPAALCQGSKTFKVEVFGTDELGPKSTVESVNWTWVNNSALKVRYVRISYQGRLTTDDEALRTLIRAFDMLPYPPTDLGPSWLNSWNTGQDLNTDGGRKAMLGHLVDQHHCTLSEAIFPWEDDCPDDDHALWVGVVSANIRGRSRVGESTVISASFDFDGDRGAAHELGHLLCLLHVNRGCNGFNPDKSTSCGGGKGYDTLPFGGQIREVPFDPFNNRVVGWSLSDPNLMVFDFMSYACTRWISETNWRRLIDGIFIPGGG